MITTTQGQLNKVFERIVHDKNGVLIRVLFTVVHTPQGFQAQIISATPLVVEKKTATEHVYLPALEQNEYIPFVYTESLYTHISPFNPLFFFNSQPTRAPSN